jgi:hypothetical protein
MAVLNRSAPECGTRSFKTVRTHLDAGDPLFSRFVGLARGRRVFLRLLETNSFTQRVQCVEPAANPRGGKSNAITSVPYRACRAAVQGRFGALTID